MIVMIFIMTKITVQILHDCIMYLTKTGLEKMNAQHKAFTFQILPVITVSHSI